MRAFAHIAAAFPEWDLEVYGDGPLRESLKWLAGRLAPDRIHLRGFVRGEYEILAGADLFVSASWIEGFGNAIWEALASGVPVVATTVGAESFDADGQFVRADDPRAFGEACVRLLDDPHAGRAMAEAARAYAVSNLTWDHAAGSLIEVLARAGG